MKQFIVRFTVVLMAFFFFEIKAQDPQYSQNYAVPNLISPAFAGLEGRSKLNFLYRNQWPNLSSNYIFSGFSADLAFEKYQSGLGIVLTNDSQYSNLETNSAGLQYAYHLKLNDYSSLSMGISGTYITRKINPNNFFFLDQARNSISRDIPGSSTDPILFQIMNGREIVDLGSGLLYTTETSWLGLSVQHLNRPNQSLSPDYPNNIKTKYSLQIGTKIPLSYSLYEDGSYQAMNEEKSLSPVIHFKKQGNFSQLDIGTYLTYAPLIVGAWYRGVPIQSKRVPDKKLESIVMLLGYRKDNFSIGYSYDLTVSNLGPSTGGAHEISIAYIFDFSPNIGGKNNIRKILRRSLACPKF